MNCSLNNDNINPTFLYNIFEDISSKYFAMSSIAIYGIVLIQFSVSSKSEYLPESLIESTIVRSIEATLTPLIISTKEEAFVCIGTNAFFSNSNELNGVRDETVTVLYT